MIHGLRTLTCNLAKDTLDDGGGQKRSMALIRPAPSSHPDRKTLRKECLLVRDGLDPQLRCTSDAAIATHLRGWLATLSPPRPSDAALALWWPIGSEPDLRPFFAGFRALGWTLALPCVVGRGRALRFAVYDTDAPLRKVAFGLREPACPRWVEPWAIAAPCVGFWGAYRLGYGGGYYDRTLAHSPALARSRSAAIAYSQSRINAQDAFAPQPLDQTFSVIITEQGLIEPDSRTTQVR
jgi:5,10-methenyltetrahydrofolate synthetase